MLTNKKRVFIAVGSGLTLLAVVAGVWLLGRPVTASAADNLKTETQSVMPGLLGEGYLNHGGGWNFPGIRGGDIDYQQLLADALGISVADLQAAYQTARDAAIDKAVEAGLITQEQADEMKVWGGLGRRGGLGVLGRAPKGVANNTIDENALLADALGITVDELQAAREAANQAAIQQAVAEGLITQEEADAMQARQNVRSYLTQDALLARALGMSLEDLQAAYKNGETLSTLMRAKGLDAATVREKLQTAYTAALAQAVKDGVITQEQADAMSQDMQDGPGFGMMPFEGRGGDRGPGPGRGGFRNGAPVAPDTEDESGTDFRTPGRTAPVEDTDA